MGDMKMRMNPLGNRKTSSVHTAAEKGGGHQRVLQRRADASPFARAEAGRKDGLGGWPTLYAQHWTMVLTFTITPYTASASVPSPCRIWRLNSMVRMPMAMSRKNVEKPVVRICRSLVPAFRKRTAAACSAGEKKWDASP